jgi:hypothetical protein
LTFPLKIGQAALIYPDAENILNTADRTRKAWERGRPICSRGPPVVAGTGGCSSKSPETATIWLAVLA